jgi:IS5 family transposase
VVNFAKKLIKFIQNLANLAMKPKKNHQNQGLLFQQRLSDELNPRHELYILAQLIDWEYFEKEFSVIFDKEKGAPAKPIRLIIGILMLQHMYDVSDERAIRVWIENPYWQYFCGYDYLQWKLPLNPSSLCRWRQRLGEEGMEKVLAVTIKTAVEAGAVKASSLKTVTVDTTVMPKNITYPTDSKLYFKGIQTLVRMAKDHNIELRQTYTFLSKNALRKVGQYSHARQMKRARRESKRLKTFLGRIVREIVRQISENSFLEAVFNPVLEVVKKVLAQERNSKNKVYSIHEPEVECISKGKAHKKYEFGCKASVVLTHKEGLALGVQALHGNPYDGHTLKTVLEKAEALSGREIDRAYVDKGYKGHGADDKQIFISGQKKGVTRWIKKQMHRRQAIEPHIGHMKSDGRLDRNYLKGILGDKLNALLCGIGHNLRLVILKLCRSKEICPT